MKYHSTSHVTNEHPRQSRQKRRNGEYSEKHDSLLNWAHGFVYRLTGLDFNKAWFGLVLYASIFFGGVAILYLITNYAA